MVIAHAFIHDMEPDLNIPKKRRSRMHRSPTGKRIELTPRDIEIFTLLSRYRYLRSTYLHAFVGGDKTKLIERLGDLYHEGRYLNRPEEQWRTASARHKPAVYEIAPRGFEALRHHGVLADDPVTWLSRDRPGVSKQFEHALMICDILASIELGARECEGLRFISWPEILHKTPPATQRSDRPFSFSVLVSHRFVAGGPLERADFNLVPDAVFGLEYTDGERKSYRFFALEADRATMPVARTNLRGTSYLRKVLGYRQVLEHGLYRTELGMPNLLVLTVTANEEHMRNVMRLLSEIGGSTSLFLFKTAAAFGITNISFAPSTEMLTQPWERTGCPMLPIGYP
jgi:hypothetical protein